MQRGRARWPRPPRGARGGRTGRTSQFEAQPHHHPSHPAYSAVPPYSAINPGISVSIVLKQDQPTGRQVTGVVADLLTRGDHPRGVKVRLRDGRVGRVQGVVSAEEGERGENGVGGQGAGLGRDGQSRVARGWKMERDIRDEDDYLYDESRRTDAAGAGLFAALEEADKRHLESRKDVGGEGVVHCPVCREFEGDEVAVARHVEEHFGN